MRDLFLGAGPAFVSHPDVPKFWLMGYVLAYHSPGDWMYNAVRTPCHPVRFLTRFVEAVDVVITLPGAYEKAIIDPLFPASHPHGGTEQPPRSAGIENVPECHGCWSSCRHAVDIWWRPVAVPLQQGSWGEPKSGVDEPGGE